jgi:hypothetical protein
MRRSADAGTAAASLAGLGRGAHRGRRRPADEDRLGYAIDSVSNALFMFTMPELFRKPVSATGDFNR